MVFCMRKELGGILAILLCAAVAGVDGGTSPTIVGSDGARMVLVPAGPFTMGTGDGEIEAAPPHIREIPAYYIDCFEVTNGLYAGFVSATGAAPPLNWNGQTPPAGWENLPVTDITWFDAMRYAIWAGKRLPTEAEWEKAARGTDGRRYPWGDIDDESHRNKDTGKLSPVGRYAPGASPCGAMDVSGNAWEWTADWYQAYPGTSAKSIHFGDKYKVVRGGGAEYLYGIANTCSTTQRARLLAYGSHDFVGFRCVKSVEPEHRPYEPQKLIDEATSLVKGVLRPQVLLSYESEYHRYVRDGTIPIEVAGRPGQSGHVRGGVPFPQGLLTEAGQVGITGPTGEPVPTQASVLSRWEDSSVRWLLVDFAAAAGEKYRLDFKGRVDAPPVSHITVGPGDNGLKIDTGAISIYISREKLMAQVRGKDGQVLLGPLKISLEAEAPGGPVTLSAMPAEKIEVEEAGPLRATVKLSGPLGANGEASHFRYDFRISAVAGSSRLEMGVTTTHMATRETTASIKDASLTFSLAQPSSQVLIGTDQGTHAADITEPILVSQPNDLSFQIIRDAENINKGTRAPGWLAVDGKAGWITLGVRRFWQNHPVALFAGRDSIGARLWAGPQPLQWEGGLAKTHEIIVDFSGDKPQQCQLSPLRATAPPAWTCGTEALGGPLLPRCTEAIERFAYWELVREASMQRWTRSMLSGFRDFGDAYLGGPYKGKNAYSNIEYDVHFNFLMAFMRTGDVWYLTAAEAMSRHQADVDTDHFTGQPWKHSPLHTTTRAEFGHVFVRGLLLHHLLTGDRRSLEVAREIGEGVGNERQIVWSLYAMTGLYDVTRDRKYLDAAEALCDRLISGQGPTGRFAIRWDNRIAFFNGIAMNGMLTVYDHNADANLAEGIMKVAERTLGLYPEYACRTLNAFCWAARRKNDARYLDMLEKTWETSMNYLMARSPSAEETHAWRFTHTAAKHQILPLFEGMRGPLPDAGTWRGTRLDGGRVELFLRRCAVLHAPIMLILEGTATGRAELFDASGRCVRTFGFVDDSRLFQPVTFELPDGGAFCRLRLEAPGANAWQIHSDAGTMVTFHEPDGRDLPNLFPRAFGFVGEGTAQVKVILEAVGEGYHTATLYDPEGNPAGSVRHFVDRDDKGRYEVPLAASVAGRFGKWSLEVSKARVIGTEGFKPYWAPTAEDLFDPEQIVGAK
jgi:formylglycine-generating enzyme required for sulfatase activity